MLKKLFLFDEDSFRVWKDMHTGKGIDWYEETPESYPCMIVWHKGDISNSMSYGWEVNSEFIYPSDFE